MNWGGVSRGVLWFVIGLVVAGAAFMAIRRGDTSDPYTVRSYFVAPEVAHETKTALTEALGASANGPGLGQVTLASDGRLLVSARESIQSQVARILADVAAKKPTPTPSIHFEVWMVSATSAGGGPPKEVPALQEIDSVLDGIRKSKGPLRFDLVEKLALQTRAGADDVEIQGARSSLRVTSTVRTDASGQPVIGAKISLRVGAHGGTVNAGALKALAELHPGELLAIGQSSLTDVGGQFGVTNPTSTESTSGSQLYYIVRATL
jgi:hypothetical protein